MPPKRIYNKKQKAIRGWGYWGDYGEIEVGISSGRVGADSDFQKDQLHYHKRGIVYILVTEGEGEVEVEGKEITISKDQVLRISPGEKYRHVGVKKIPFSWITFCTSKDLDDKVIVTSD